MNWKRLLVSLLCCVVVMGSTTPSLAEGGDWQCGELDSYLVTLQDALPDELEEIEATLDDVDDMLTIRPSELRELSELVDDMASSLEGIDESDIPRAAEEFHEAWIDILSFASLFFLSVAEGGVLAAMVFADTGEQASEAMNDAEILGYERCGDDWITDVGVEDEAEAIATPAASSSLFDIHFDLIASTRFVDQDDGSCRLARTPAGHEVDVKLQSSVSDDVSLSVPLSDGRLTTTPQGEMCLWRVTFEDVPPVDQYNLILNGEIVEEYDYHDLEMAPSRSVDLD